MVRIRPGRPGDLDALRRIQARALVEPWPELLEPATRGTVGLFVAEDEKPVGYAVVLAGPEDVAYVPELAVHPDHQNKGYGSQLLSVLLDHLDREAYSEVRLTVQAGDERARRFYDRHGFEELQRLADHFESGDGLLLSREL